MNNPSPFHVAQQIGTNFYNQRKESNDNSAIEEILSQSMQSEDPKVLQQNIGKILSQVSPERQPMAIKLLQDSMQNIQKKNQLQQRNSALQEQGIDPNLPESLQKMQYENISNENRANKILNPNMGGVQNSNGNLQQNQNIESSLQKSFNGLSDEQLVQLTGVKGYSEPAKQELKRRQEESKIDEKINSTIFKSDLNRSNKFIDNVDEIASQLPTKEKALSLLDHSITTKNLGAFTLDNLAEISGIQAFISPEGALFKNAGKEYFLGSLKRAGARPNQWIEQQIADMLLKVGRSTAANLSVSRALKGDLEIDKERIRLTNEISDQLEKNGDRSRSKLPQMVNQKLSEYAKNEQANLFNDLRAIKAIDEKKPQKFQVVKKGTRVSQFVAQALLNQFNNDPKKAADEAKKLGYEF